jgi:hypothetical protein
MVWRGRGNPDGLVWEQDIYRYTFTSGEQIVIADKHGDRTAVRVGESWKISKRDAHKFFTKGYIELFNRYCNAMIHISSGKIGLDIETRVLREHEVTPESVKPPKRKKK